MSSNIHVYMYTVGHTFYPSKRNMQKQKSKGRGKCGKWYERVFFFQNEATFPLVWESYTHVCKCMIVRENADTDMIVCVNTKHIHEHRHSVNKMDCLW